MAKPSQQQQAVKDTIVLQAVKFILDDQNASDFAKQAKQNPVEAMVNITSAVLKNIKDSAAAAGRNYVGDPMFLMAAAKEVMAHEMKMLVAFGIVPQQQAPQILRQAIEELTTVIGGGQQQPQPQGMLAQGA